MTNTILMIKPVAFHKNEETAVNNYYQKDTKVLESTIQTKALKEFNTLVSKLEKVGVKVIVIKDTKTLKTPDSIFPNNWISFHEKGEVCIYPMFAKNRRNERRDDVLEAIEKEGFKIKHVVDYTSAEDEGLFLEGTGSMVLDRINKVAYCSLSPRSSEDLFIEFCEDMEYTPIIFRAYHSVNGKRKPIYHTNMMLSIGEKFAITCLQTIDDKKERKQVAEMLQNSGKEVINISKEQVDAFAANVLQVKGDDDKNFIAMSTTAFASLSKAQVSIIEKHGKIIKSNITTIEENGGGSVRCMLAEVF